MSQNFFSIQTIDMQSIDMQSIDIRSDYPFYSPNPDEDIDVLDVEDVENITAFPCKVILFNDEIHTFEEVTFQIIKATKCSIDKAEALTWEVHSKGKAVVFSGEMNECLQVSGVLEEIALSTQIEM